MSASAAQAAGRFFESSLLSSAASILCSPVLRSPAPAPLCLLRPPNSAMNQFVIEIISRLVLILHRRLPACLPVAARVPRASEIQRFPVNSFLFGSFLRSNLTLVCVRRHLLDISPSEKATGPPDYMLWYERCLPQLRCEVSEQWWPRPQVKGPGRASEQPVSDRRSWGASERASVHSARA